PFHGGRLADYRVEGLPAPEAGKRGEVLWTGEKSRLPQRVRPGDEPVTVVEHRAEYRGRNHYYLRTADEPFEVIYDNSGLPGFLFLGSAGITALILVSLWLIMP